MDPVKYKAVVKIGETNFSSQVESFNYTDEANGASDSLSVTLNDILGKWHGEKMPNGASRIIAKIKKVGGGASVKIFRCGIFYLDDMEFQGYPSTATFGAVSDPVSYAFKNRKRNRTWKDTNLKQVTEDISKDYPNLKIVYDAERIPIKTLEQTKQTDSSFLNSLTDKYGCGMKLYSNKIVVYSIERYEKRKATKTIYKKQMEPGWTYHTTINKNYTGVKLVYKTTGGKKIETQHGSTKRMLSLSEKAESKEDAIRIALARVNKENADTTTLKFTLRTPQFLTATSCINIKGMGKLNGKYFITRVRHTISNGYKVQVECRKITKRIE